MSRLAFGLLWVQVSLPVRVFLNMTGPGHGSTWMCLLSVTSAPLDSPSGSWCPRRCKIYLMRE
jgi:hypothetical protein